MNCILLSNTISFCLFQIFFISSPFYSQKRTIKMRRHIKNTTNQITFRQPLNFSAQNPIYIPFKNMTDPFSHITIKKVLAYYMPFCTKVKQYMRNSGYRRIYRSALKLIYSSESNVLYI